MESQLAINTNLSENLDYNTIFLPVKARYAEQSYYVNYKAPCHWHSDIECVYVTEGILHYYVNDHEFVLYPGDGIFVNANRLHFNESKNNKEAKYLVLVMNPSCLATNPMLETQFINPVIYNDATDAIVFSDKPWHKDALHLIKKIVEDSQPESSVNPLELLSSIYNFWNLLYLDAISKEQTDSSVVKVDALKDMITYVQLNYRDKITLDEIAEAGTMCKSKCCHLFKTHLRQSPMTYLAAYRIRASLSLLTNTTDSITDIALACGFNSGSYYTETFQKVMKMTPKEYRRQNTTHKKAGI